MTVNSENLLSTKDMNAPLQADECEGEEGKTKQDEVVGLEMSDGSVFYCRRSTLAMASPQFLATEPTMADSNGRSIYFVEGDSELFQKHILPYLRSNKTMLPPGDLDLWNRLRAEAVVFGMDGLVATLDADRPSISANDDDVAQPSNASNSSDNTDNIIGLQFTDGQVRYCPRSVLTSASETYFPAHFRGSSAEDVDWYDYQGHPVYFIARNGYLYLSTTFWNIS